MSLHAALKVFKSNPMNPMKGKRTKVTARGGRAGRAVTDLDLASLEVGHVVLQHQLSSKGRGGIPLTDPKRVVTSGMGCIEANSTCR